MQSKKSIKVCLNCQHANEKRSEEDTKPVKYFCNQKDFKIVKPHYRCKNWNRKTEFTCTVCQQEYTANYNGQFPVCQNCQWKIHSYARGYHYCRHCNMGILVNFGEPAKCRRCQSTKLRHIKTILDGVNIERLREWHKEKYCTKCRYRKSGNLIFDVCTHESQKIGEKFIELIDIKNCKMWQNKKMPKKLKK
ncbi:MAG: hypothetical protein FWG64_07455 [Firmicutes bacterium]|nr:hypothetical protein [Bacillota bacterium]